MASKRIPKWEAELWSDLGNGDRTHCPLYQNCSIRRRDSWCADDDREHLNWLSDSRRFHLRSFDFMESRKCYGEFKMVEMLAQKYLNKGNVVCPPVSSELISLADEQYPIEVRLVPLKTCHGAIWRLKEEWVIQLNADDRPGTRRFTLFHEAFHIMAHCNTTPVFKKRGAKVGGFNELLADFFAAYVLMPREWVEEKWAEVHDLTLMVKIFDVPKSAMCIRLKQLGLI